MQKVTDHSLKLWLDVPMRAKTSTRLFDFFVWPNSLLSLPFLSADFSCDWTTSTTNGATSLPLILGAWPQEAMLHLLSILFAFNFSIALQDFSHDFHFSYDPTSHTPYFKIFKLIYAFFKHKTKPWGSCGIGKITEIHAIGEVDLKSTANPPQMEMHHSAQLAEKSRLQAFPRKQFWEKKVMQGRPNGVWDAKWKKKNQNKT